MGIEKVHSNRMEVWQSEKSGEFYFHHVDGNNEVTSHGEGYTRLADAIAGAQNDHPGLAVVVLPKDPNG